MNYVISEELAQTILQYLVYRPYREVATMVYGLNTLQPIAGSQAGCPQMGGPGAALVDGSQNNCTDAPK